MPKKKLLMILGAGSSVAHGMPSVSDLDEKMLRWSREWARSHPEDDNYYEKVYQNALGYGGHDVPQERRLANFEQCLGDLIDLAHWLRGAPHGNPLRQWVANGRFPPALRFSKGIGGNNCQCFRVLSQAHFLLTRLANHMRETCLKLDITTSAFSAYRTVIDGLRERFAVGILNLNYDNISLSAWPGAFTGFSTSGDFEPDRLHERRDWGFIYHLHGSVYHRLVNNVGPGIYWESDLTKVITGEDSDGRLNDIRSDRRLFPRTTLIAGGAKPEQLLGEPYQSLYSAAVRHMHEADAMVLGGFGLGDAHVTFALQACWLATRRQIPLMILTKSKRDDAPLLWRNGTFAARLRKSFGIKDQQFWEKQAASFWLRHIVDTAAFEVSDTSERPLAAWHGGFHEASTRLEPIARWLNGERDALPR